MNKEEALVWLKDFMKTVNNQDNRRTATPYYFTICTEDPESRTLHNRNVFFTEDAAERHLRENRHNMPHSYTYLDHAYRNSEILTLLQAIGAVVDEPYERK